MPSLETLEDNRKSSSPSSSMAKLVAVIGPAPSEMGRERLANLVEQELRRMALIIETEIATGGRKTTKGKAPKVKSPRKKKVSALVADIAELTGIDPQELI